MTGRDVINILAINAGSTSTKIALFVNETEKYRDNLEHSGEELSKFKTIADSVKLLWVFKK